MKYRQALVGEGMHDDRALEAVIALSSLYRSLNQMDRRNLDLFMSKSIEQRLSEFATTEVMRDFIADRNKTLSEQP